MPPTRAQLPLKVLVRYDSATRVPVEDRGRNTAPTVAFIDSVVRLWGDVVDMRGDTLMVLPDIATGGGRQRVIPHGLVPLTPAQGVTIKLTTRGMKPAWVRHSNTLVVVAGILLSGGWFLTHLP